MGETSSNPAVELAVYAAVMYDVIAAACSSPQTTEINASVRAESLMKWVHLGVLQGTLFVALGMATTTGKRWPPLLGGGLAAALMYASYYHAKKCGLENPGTPTETPGGWG